MADLLGTLCMLALLLVDAGVAFAVFHRLRRRGYSPITIVAALLVIICYVFVLVLHTTSIPKHWLALSIFASMAPVICLLLLAPARPNWRRHGRRSPKFPFKTAAAGLAVISLLFTYVLFKAAKEGTLSISEWISALLFWVGPLLGTASLQRYSSSPAP